MGLHAAYIGYRNGFKQGFITIFNNIKEFDRLSNELIFNKTYSIFSCHCCSNNNNDNNNNDNYNNEQNDANNNVENDTNKEEV